MKSAPAGCSRVRDTGGRGNVAAKQPADGPKHSVGGEGSAAVPERVGQVQEDLPFPSNREERSTGRVEKQEAIPSREINFKHLEFPTRELATVALDHGNDIV